MDMKAIGQSSVKATNNTASSSAAASLTGQGPVSKGKSDGFAFSNMLQTEISSETTQDQASAINSELLAAMSLTPQALQLILNGLEGAEGDQSLVASLLASMNSDSELTQTLLNDSDVQKWLQEANLMLSAWAAQTSGIGGSSALNGQSLNLQNLTNNSDSSDSNALAMQRTLMTLATLSQGQPNHPILQHILAGLQQVINPYSASLEVSSGAQLQGAELLAQNLSAKTGKNVQQDPAFNRIKGADVALQALGSTDENKQSEAKIIVQSPLSKLELLAAKSLMNFAQFAGSTDDSGELSKLDTTSSIEMSNPMQTGLKNPLMAMDSSKVALPTMNGANFAEDMSQFLVKTMKVSLMGNGVSEAKITLQPQNLGHIDVKLTIHNGTLIAQIATQTMGAKELLESQLPQLRLMLQNQGLQVDKLEVTQSSSAGSMMFQDQGRQQNFNQERFTSSGSNSDSYGLEETELMQEIADAKENMRKEGIANSSFHASV